MQNEKWYESQLSDNSIIISSRVRLARNLKNYLFPLKLSSDDAKKMIHEVTTSVLNEAVPGDDVGGANNTVGSLRPEEGSFRLVDLKGFSGSQQQGLLENHIISPLFLLNKDEKALFMKDDESASIMINEEDHIRIQTILPGDNIDDAYKMADQIDDIIEQSIDYAFDKEYGYLTACPTNTGTGLRASFMLHLPALEMTGRLEAVIPSISKFRLTLRGIYGEGSESLGSIYQLSNQITLGYSESEIIKMLKTFSKSIIDEENLLRQKLFTDSGRDLEDKISRSYGILTNAKKLNAKEAMALLSNIRLGFNTGMLKKPHPQKTIYNIMMEIQPGNIQKIVSYDLNENERDFLRAQYIQECLNNGI